MRRLIAPDAVSSPAPPPACRAGTLAQVGDLDHRVHAVPFPHRRLVVAVQFQCAHQSPSQRPTIGYTCHNRSVDVSRIAHDRRPDTAERLAAAAAEPTPAGQGREPAGSCTARTGHDRFAEAAAVGLGVDLELATIKAAFEAATDLDQNVTLTLNASPALLADPRLLEVLDWHRTRTVVVEVTEHTVVDDYHQLETALTVLRESGIRVAVDDAGAGFASFRHIVRLRPEFIKLDLSPPQNLRNDPIRRPLAEALVRFAHQTDSRIIAEGIETAADLATWQELGAHAAQGYLFGRPGPLPVSPHAHTHLPTDRRVTPRHQPAPQHCRRLTILLA